jgi:steroid delta-isomerase-like uncharacterized protein
MDYRARTQEVNDATYAAWNAHDAAGVAAVFAEDAVTREAAGGMEMTGREAVRLRAELLLAAFPDFHLERLELVVDGDRHADRWIMTGTHLGDFMGVAPTGRKVRIAGATFTRLDEEGLVVEDTHFSDTEALLAQLQAP